MKLATFETTDRPGQVAVGVLTRSGDMLDLTAAGGNAGPASMLDLLAGGEAAMDAARAALADAEAGKLGEHVRPAASVKLHAPVPRPGKILHTSCNFAKHLDELTTWKSPEWQSHNWGSFHYEHPTGFLEAPSAVVGPEAVIPIPIFTNELDYELELGIVIGRDALNVSVDDAASYIAGYTVFNDISARELQAREHSNKVILLGKSFQGSCPFGPYLVTRDEFDDDIAVDMHLKLNGETRQNASTSHMRFSPRELVSWWSLGGLEPGDIITSGSPPGVIAGEKDPSWLKPGDRIDAHVDGIGTLTTIIGEKIR